MSALAVCPVWEDSIAAYVGGVALTRQQLVTAVLRGDYERVGMPPPALEPVAHYNLLKRILGEYDLDPTEDPERLLKSEGFALQYVPMPGKCGACYGEMILAPYVLDPRARALVIQHERMHAWSRRLRRRDVNDSDIWILTAGVIAAGLERFGYERSPAFPHAPDWAIPLILGADEG